MKKFLLTAALLVAATFSWAQDVPTLPIDATIKTGKLDNGLTYFIRHNAKPANRAEFYLATNVGAIQETPDQDGLAHFLEHMCFNGTKNFPGKGILNWLESIGASFGGNVNASTGVEQTIYLLNNIPLIRPSVVDSCLLIMHDYSHFVTCDPAEIDKERGVILEEKRTRNTASWRTFEKMQPYLYGDSKYNGCTIIGSEENLKTFKPESLVSFYKTWYRPDLQALIVVGDIDVDEVEAKIKSIFDDIPASVNPKAKDVITIPDNVEPIVGILTDPETTQNTFEVMWKRGRMPEEYNNTTIGYTNDLVNSLIRSILRERLNDIRTSPDAPFVAASASTGKLSETVDILDFEAVFEDGKALSTLETLLIEAKKLKLYGVNDSELERAKSNILARYESNVKSADSRSNGEFVMPIISYFFDNNSLLDPETDLMLAQQFLPMLSCDLVNQYAQQIVTDENMVVLYSGAESAQTPSKEEVLQCIDKVKNTEIEMAAGEEIPESLLDKDSLKGGKIKKTKPYIYGSEILTLSNGMTVILYKTDKVKDRIDVELFKQGGMTLINDEDIFSFEDNIWNVYNNNSGVSDFNLKTLKKMLAGKVVSVSPFINGTSHGVSSTSSTKDLETALQLIYLYITDPRFDAQEYGQGIKQIQAMLPNLKNNPSYKLQKEFISTLYDSDRRIFLDEEVLAKANLATLERVYRELFSGANGATAIICGDIDIEATRELVCKYFGSLAKGKKPSKVIDRNDDIVRGVFKNEFTAQMSTPKVTCVDIFSMEAEASTELKLTSRALKYILDMTYTETLREDEGGTYGAGVLAEVDHAPYNTLLLQVLFDTNTEQAEKLKSLVVEGLEKIATEGPNAEMYNKTIMNLQKLLPERMESLGFWSSCIKEYMLYGEDYIDEYDKVLKSITPEKIKALASEILSSGNRIEVIMKPE